MSEGSNITTTFINIIDKEMREKTCIVVNYSHRITENDFYKHRRRN